MHARKAVLERHGLSRGIPSTNDDLTAEHNSVTPPHSFTSLMLNCRVPEIDYYNLLTAPSGEFLPLLQLYYDGCTFPSAYQSQAFFESPLATVTVTSS